MAAAAEEVLFRGVILAGLLERYALGPGLLLAVVGFALADHSLRTAAGRAP